MRVVAVILVCMVAVTASAQDAGVEGVFAFGAGARALAMGGAFTALGDDGTSIYWNPASLALLSRREVTSLHVPLYYQSAYNFFGLTVPTRTLGGFGLGGINARTGGIELRDARNLRIGESSYSETEYLLSYGGRLPRLPLLSRVLDPVYGGITLKLVHQRLAELSDIGAGGDLGFLYTPRRVRGLRMGVALQNLLSPGLKLRQESDRLPLLLKGGASYSTDVGSTGDLTLAFDLEKTSAASLKYRLGGEFNIRERLALRAGWNGSPAVGFGLSYWGAGFDYAYVSRELGPLHCFSVSMRLGRTIEEDWIAVREREAEERRRRAEEERRSKIEEHAGAAVEAYEDGDYFAALGEWQKVLGFDPESEEARGWVNRITEEIQRSQESEIEDRRLLAQINEHIDAGVEFLAAGEYGSAISAWNRVLQLDPENSIAQDYLQRTRARLSQEIADHLRQAQLLEGEGKFGEALSEWREVLRLDPASTQGARGVERVSTKIEEAHHINRGFSYFSEGEYERAAEEFRTVLALNPENKTALEYLRKSVGRKSLAEIAGDREVWNLYLRGIEHFTRGEYEAAIEVWEEVLELDPENENAVRNIEEAKLRLRRTREE